MQLADAKTLANQFNLTGKHRDKWFYYVACHDGGNMPDKSRFLGEWFVMRRPKGTEVQVAVYGDGTVHISES